MGFRRAVVAAWGIAAALAAGNAAAQQPQPGWIADSGTGCKVWNPSPQPDETIAWSGGCANGLAQGAGVLQWFEAGRPNDKYAGEYRDGKMHGRGVYTSANGNRYDGEWRDNKRNGGGVYTFANGDRYDGQWRDDKAHGRGVFTWANGDRYDGEWRDDKRNGRGVLTWADGSRYDGEWRDGTQHGRGVWTWADGDRYDGEWRDDRPSGSGTYYSAKSGETYTGFWSNGCFSQGDRKAAVGATKEECGFR